MKKILTLAALTAAILTTNIPTFATADLPDLRISNSGQQTVEVSNRVTDTLRRVWLCVVRR